MTWDRAWLESAGFGGFVAFNGIQQADVPPSPGVYVLVRPDLAAPHYLDTSSGGSKRGDPTVSLDLLSAAWIAEAHVVYIGKATNLRKRLAQYWRYGRGSNSHRGGRYVWQLANSGGLLVAWREHPDASPLEVEQGLIGDFKRLHGKWPFANLKD